MKEIDNRIYDRLAPVWWDDEANGTLSTIRFFINPVRFGYFRAVLEERRGGRAAGASVLDAGCGGGFLSEEFARLGCRVAGVDLSRESIAAARAHAVREELDVAYAAGDAGRLPFRDGSFDAACCCDVLEHVADPEGVIAEIARVLRPGGVFFYDTVNRTPASWLVVIKVMQEWKATAFAEPGVHVWRMFLKPAELACMTGRHGLEPGETRGLSPGWNMAAHCLNLRRRARGKISFRELGGRLGFHAGRNTWVSYMGYTVKK